MGSICDNPPEESELLKRTVKIIGAIGEGFFNIFCFGGIAGIFALLDFLDFPFDED